MKFVELKYKGILTILVLGLGQTAQIQNKLLFFYLKILFCFIKIKPLRTASMALKLNLPQL